MERILLAAQQVVLRKDVLLSLACAVFFYSFSQIDLWVSGLFYDATLGFYLNQNPLVYGVYWLFARLQYLILILLLGFTVSSVFRPKLQAQLWRKNCRFIFFFLLLGPGIVVNGLAKNHSIGRERPVQIEQFGGQGQFTPAFVYSGVCQKNCSFVSGHASLGFAFMALFFLYRRPSVFVLGLSVGVIVGLGRIMQGGHFLSDVVFGFWFTYFSMLLVAKFMVYECHWLGIKPLGSRLVKQPILGLQ